MACQDSDDSGEDEKEVVEQNETSSVIVGVVRWETLPHGTSEAEWQVEHAERCGMPALDDFLIRIFPVEKQVVGCDIPHIRECHAAA